MSHREKKKKKKGEAPKDERFYELRNAAYANLPLARKIIKADPTIVAAKNSIGETALHFLAVENQLEAVEFLAKHGSDINNENNFGQSVLVEVARIGHIEMIDLLLRMRVKVDIAAIVDEMESMDVDEEQQERVVEVLGRHGFTS
jgi:ankyrin repeat protein